MTSIINLQRPNLVIAVNKNVVIVNNITTNLRIDREIESTPILLFQVLRLAITPCNVVRVVTKWTR